MECIAILTRFMGIYCLPDIVPVHNLVRGNLREQLGVQCEAARAEVAELKEQQLEAEEETKQLTHKVLELETDRDTWQLERENLRCITAHPI